MHGFHKAIEKRLTALERLVGTIAETETPDQTSRRLVLVSSALVGETPGDLQEDERLVFSKIEASVPVFQELIDEGLVDGHGEPSVVDDLRDETEDGELVWVP